MANINSPCVRNCCLNEADICPGCFRSIDEIIKWNDLTDQLKLATLVLTNARRHAHFLKYSSMNKNNNSNENP